MAPLPRAAEEMERPVGYRVTLSVMDGFVFGLGIGLAVLVLYGLLEFAGLLMVQVAG